MHIKGKIIIELCLVVSRKSWLKSTYSKKFYTGFRKNQYLNLSRDFAKLISEMNFISTLISAKVNVTLQVLVSNRRL